MKKEEKLNNKENFTKLTHKKGISLIVLIVTIIVIIILAAAVILTISKNNPVESAREATFKEDVRAFQDELALTVAKEYTNKQGQRDTKINATASEVTNYIPSLKKEYAGKFVIVNDELKYVEDEVTEKEIEWLDDLDITSNSNVPVDWKQSIATVTDDGVPIPKGFTYVTGTKETGTVIQDSLGNEFVWVPATEATYVKDFSFPSKYGEATSSNTSDDKLPSGITDETYDVNKYGGFYIARYEAGIPTGDTSPSNKTGVPVSKKGATVWIYINYTNAKASAESMINNEYVQTGLLTGKAWDTTCHFIEDSLSSINSKASLADSRYYGNSKNSESPANVSGYGIKQVTGYSDKWMVKNIYDLAGNVYEWTNEVYSSNRIERGGSCYRVGDGCPVSYRDYDSTSNGFINVGFRSRLYIK